MLTDKIAEDIYRIKVPFENIFTTVYVYICEKGVALIDSATYSEDADKYIIPALRELKIEKVKYLLLTHNHDDHMGGIYRLKEIFSDACVGATFKTDFPDSIVLTDGQKIIGDLQTVLLPGHTHNSAGYFDLKTKTLLSGDCLQLSGIDKYRGGIAYSEQYINSCNKLKNMDIEKIVAAHEYEPLGSIADGKKEVKEYLNKCIEICIKEKTK